MNLHSIFKSIAYKQLVRVDFPSRGSHQHEINGVAELKNFFGISDDKISGQISWCYFADDVDPVRSSGSFTFYDARKKGSDRTGRSEWRMYYSGEFLDTASPGDVLILVKTQEEHIYGMLFQRGSGWLRAARTLFSLHDLNVKLRVRAASELNKYELEFARQRILEELEIEVDLPGSSTDEDTAVRELAIAKKMGLSFPSTRKMSELAQKYADIEIIDADLSLVALLECEERIFRAMEKILVQEKLNVGFESVDDFIQYSLSVQNRRKSRMGQALQNHLSFLFAKNRLKFETQKATENKKKPDFLFPGQKEYRNKEFDAGLLVMLGAKSTCKERWTQILTEAERIPNKHLCTLEQAISFDQTSEMKRQKVTLVLPATLHISYSEEQLKDIISVAQFIEFVKRKQK